jgi:hypothetical protein
MTEGAYTASNPMVVIGIMSASSPNAPWGTMVCASRTDGAVPGAMCLAAWSRRTQPKGWTMTSLSVKPLDETTWPDFARLAEKHNGIWGGCWCMAFHPEGVGQNRTAAQNRSDKERRVREGQAHAALVYDGSACVGWCQFGPTDELPRIKNT